MNKPLRRWIVIDSAKRKKQDAYDIQYENVPHFCFSCGQLGHADPFCPTPSQRDANGELPFGSKLRASDERKRTASSDFAGKEYHVDPSSHRDSKHSSNISAGGTEVNSPRKKGTHLNNRKEAPKQVYRCVDSATPLLLTAAGEGLQNPELGRPKEQGDGEDLGTEGEFDRLSKKKKPTPDNSAEAVMQPCPSQ